MRSLLNQLTGCDKPVLLLTFVCEKLEIKFLSYEVILLSAGFKYF